MNENSAEFGLLDVRGIGLGELLSEGGDPAFRRALDRLLTSPDDACNSFNASI